MRQLARTIMIGGAVVKQEFADETLADFYGSDSVSAMRYVRSLVEDAHGAEETEPALFSMQTIETGDRVDDPGPLFLAVTA